MNCILVILVLTQYPNSSLIWYCLLTINIYLSFSEFIQVCNLGVEKYIGIENIHYFGNIDFVIVLLTLYFDNFYFLIPYAIIQILSRMFDKESRIQDYNTESFLDDLFLLLPYPAYLLIRPITSSSFPFFIVVAVVECLKSFYFFKFDLEGLQKYQKVLYLLLLIGYGYNNELIFWTYFSIFIVEKLVQILYYKEKGIELTDIGIILLEFASFTLVLVGYFLPSELCILFAFGIALAVCCLKIYPSMNDMHDLLQCYSFYMLIAYFDTEEDLFLYSFLTTALLEFISLKFDNLLAFKDNALKFALNWNTLDIVRALVSFAWIIFAFSNLSQPVSLTWFFVMLNFLRGLTSFRALDGTRFYILLILGSVADIFSFLFIFIYITIAFGIVNSTTIDNKNDNLFQIIWAKPYDMAHGTFDHEQDIGLEYIGFFFASLFIIIVMLNLLISILGDSYDKFQLESNKLDYKERIGTVYECEVLFFWRARIEESKIFAVCDYPPGKGKIGEDDWTGKVFAIQRTMTTTIDALKCEMKDEFKKMNSMQNELEKKIMSKLEALDKRVNPIIRPKNKSWVGYERNFERGASSDKED